MRKTEESSIENTPKLCRKLNTVHLPPAEITDGCCHCGERSRCGLESGPNGGGAEAKPSSS